MPDAQSYMDAAKALISSFEAQGVPPIAHAVFIRTSVNDEGEFQRQLVVAVNPRYRARVKLPADVRGLPIVEGKWGKSYNPREDLKLEVVEKLARTTLAAPRQEVVDG